MADEPQKKQICSCQFIVHPRQKCGGEYCACHKKGR